MAVLIMLIHHRPVMAPKPAERLRGPKEARVDYYRHAWCDDYARFTEQDLRSEMTPNL